MIKNLEEKIKAYALKNALAHEGKSQQGAVLSSLFNEGLKKEDVKSVIKDVSKAVNEINKLSLEEQEKEFEKFKKYVHERPHREGLAELPNVKKGKLVMRFAPSASGPLHIGHAATGATSALYVKKYSGVFYVRIEDTNPENIAKEAYSMIEKESKWLFGKETKIIIQSDGMKLYYEYVEKLIDKDAVYVCTCDSEKFKGLVDNKKYCPCRDLSKKENKERWEKMLGKSKKERFAEGGAVVRFKSDINNVNPALREFPLARINEAPHARQGKKFRVWPLMNLAVAVDDIDLKVSHIIRGKDHRDNALRQKMIFESLGKIKEYPWSAFLGRYNFTDMDLSTTQMRKDIEAGKYKGWDDPRLPTIAALKKQGYKPEAFWGMAIRRGLSEVDKIITKKEYFELLNYFNKHTEEVVV